MSEPISFKDFQRLDLRVGKVVGVENVPGRGKILSLLVDIGEDTRQVVVGGAEYYNPSYFMGRQVVILVNLQPKTIAGVESRGMLLAAVQGERPVWLTVEEEVKPGTKIY